jgi:uncharacterized membrane protein
MGKAEYELSEVGASIESGEKKIRERNRSMKNLLNVNYYILFIFTVFFSIIGITIFNGCSELKTNFESGMREFEHGVKTVEDFINYLPTNFSFWINEQTTVIDGITNEIVLYSVRKPTTFLNTSINEFVNRLNDIGGIMILGVDLQLNIDTIDIPEIYFDNWNMDIPTNELINVLRIIIDIPYYFGVICLSVSILFMCICFVKGLSLVMDYRSRFNFIFKISFWIGFIFAILFLLLTIGLIYVHFLYVENVGKKIEEVQRYIEGNITVYNNFMDQNEVLMSVFISDNLNVMVNTTNQLVEQLRNMIQENLNRILAMNIEILLDKFDLVNVVVSLDDFKIDPKIIDLLWINEKINSIFIGLIVFSGVCASFFVILVVIVCCEK